MLELFLFSIRTLWFRCRKGQGERTLLIFIGALVVALVILVILFLTFSKGLPILGRAQAALATAFGVLKDLVLAGVK